MPLISYISVPITLENGAVQTIRVDLVNNKVLAKFDEDEYQEVDDIGAMANDLDMYMRLGDDECCDDDECSCK